MSLPCFVLLHDTFHQLPRHGFCCCVFCVFVLLCIDFFVLVFVCFLSLNLGSARWRISILFIAVLHSLDCHLYEIFNKYLSKKEQMNECIDLIKKRGGRRKLLEEIDTFMTLIGVVSWVNTCLQIHQVVHTNYIQLFVCQLYLKNGLKKQNFAQDPK